MTDPRILITGSRQYDRPGIIQGAILSARIRADGGLGRSAGFGPNLQFPIGDRQLIIVHGAAAGADSLAGAFARKTDGIIEEVHPADWENCDENCAPGHRRWRQGRSYCPAAGPRRNLEMIRLGADLCLAFPSRSAANVGTFHCAREAESAGIKVEFHWDEA